jgi:hypothetical protein
MFILNRFYVYLDFILINNKGTWNAILAFVVPSHVYDELYIEQLEKTIKQGHRRKFSWITRQDLINQVRKGIII